MSTLAIIGAGPGLGLATARRFGRDGHAAALLSRTREHVEQLAAQLAADGITARGYVADARDPDSLRAALDAAAADLGPIDVLQYSPVPAKDFMKTVLETDAEDLVGPVEQSVYGPVAAVRHVLPGMRERGRGTILFINGGSAMTPNGGVAGTSVAFAGESAYGQMLHDALAEEGIHVAQLIIPLGIGGGDPDHEPEALAERILGLHRDRGGYRTVIGQD
ncbi:SDR family NAD(P)-dependent oxidoreductase [Brachybacterium saurashtrense]|uniref:SDR family NAD(P)-dependent oxidoreductase n=1 Tax=Brachybacterium saurashtrense TaxID=556288 RepID=A0A345YP47_9MICO|nr:SDR family NAD(P)-dependent oxidoreductase [Brachybacterium saurashtrense]AXK45699.1 SDR family NAD(P)-dependent oxidoreductase [Brachybacterium saurashtrense]RRR24717.1 SDR family NAD(P)-dependent oxidoreductase [Brachybacterium saurashtrense]